MSKGLICTAALNAAAMLVLLVMVWLNMTMRKWQKGAFSAVLLSTILIVGAELVTLLLVLFLILGTTIQVLDPTVHISWTCVTIAQILFYTYFGGGQPGGQDDVSGKTKKAGGRVVPVVLIRECV